MNITPGNNSCSTCPEHRETLKQISEFQIKENNLDSRMSNLEAALERLESGMNEKISEVCNAINSLSGSVKKIDEALLGDHHNKGWLTRIESTETALTEIKKSNEDLKKKLEGILPWFNAMKWIVGILGPAAIVGGGALLWAILTNKISII